MPTKRGDSPTSAARIVRRNALAEPTSSSENRLGARSNQREHSHTAESPAAIMTLWRASDHCQTSHRIRHQKPASQLVAGKRRKRTPMAVHDFTDKTICSAKDSKNRVPSNGSRYPLGVGGGSRPRNGSPRKPEKCRKTRCVPQVGCTLC